MSKKIVPSFVLLAAALSSLSFAQMRNMTTQEIVRDMGLGINLGNTFEAAGDWINGTTVSAYETAWGSPIITEAMIKGYADAGFKTVRIPVAWSNLMTGDAIKNNQTNGAYTISTALLDRVETVTDWVLGNGMYAIVNIHWDGGWWEKFPTDSAECMRKYKRIWGQVAARFKDKSDYLVLASLNEEGGWNDVWNPWSGGAGPDKQRAYGILRAINQAFVDTVRASGGNNGNRHLQIQGYQTDIGRTVDQAFQMPADPRNGGARLAVSVHYYDPFGFTHLEKNETWADMRMTWGTPQDYTDLNKAMDTLVNRFVNNGVPVIIGEYGFASGLPREISEVRKYTLAVTRAIYSRNMAPVLWDVQLKTDGSERIYYYNRLADPPGLVDPLFADSLRMIVSDPNTSVNGSKIAAVSLSTIRPQISVRGKTLNVSLPSGSSEARIRMIDTKGKVRASFRASGSGSFSLAKIPAGRYFVEVKGAGGVKQTMPVVVK